MMMFKAIDKITAVATNSIKTVRIVRTTDVNDYDRNLWMLYTPDGGLDDEFLTRGPFVSFGAAKRMVNCHGHIHQNASPPGLYMNMSVEAINYTPQHIEDVAKKAKKMIEKWN